MKKARIFIVIAIVLLVLLGVGFWWFWSLGSLPKQEDSGIKLAINKGVVFLSRGGSFEEPARSGMQLEVGDKIRTGEDSAASILAHGVADLRLDQNTEIIIEDSIYNDKSQFGFGLKLQAGRTWSRLLHLLDLNSFYEVRTDSVVATVRGTAFMMEKDGSEVEVYVDHAGVRVEGDGDPIFLAKEDWSKYVSGSLMSYGGAVSSSKPLNSWMIDNKKADANFMDAAGRMMVDNLQINSGPAPDVWSYGLAMTSEKMHLFFAGDKRQSMQARYIARRLGYVRDLVDRGKSGLAFHELSGVEDEVNKFISENYGEEEKDVLRGMVGDFLLSFSNIMPEDEMYRLKLRAEDIYISLWGEGSEQQLYARLLSGDSRLEEAERYDCQNKMDGSLTETLQAVEQTLNREEGEFDRFENGFSDQGRVIIAEKIEMQRTRQRVLLERLDWCDAPHYMDSGDDMNATSTTSTEEVASGTDMILEPDNQPDNTIDKPVIDNPQEPPVIDKPVETQPSLNIVKIELFAQPNPANKGDLVDLYVKGTRNDGTAVDVTDRAEFSLIGNIGSLQGATYNALSAGSVVITASVTDMGQTYNARVSLLINDGPVVLESLELLSNGSTQIYQGDNRALTVIAHYSNGQTKTVTNLVKYTLSDMRLGHMGGSIFYADFNGTGAEVIGTSYTEDGITKEAQTTLQVIADNNKTIY